MEIPLSAHPSLVLLPCTEAKSNLATSSTAMQMPLHEISQCIWVWDNGAQGGLLSANLILMCICFMFVSHQQDMLLHLGAANGALKFLYSLNKGNCYSWNEGTWGNQSFKLAF